MKDQHILRSVLLVIAMFMAWPLVFNPASLNPITWDAFGYYYYLPLIFIQKTIFIESLESVKPIFDAYQPSSTLYQFSYMENGKFIPRYSIGQAILYLPFFLLGHGYALISQYPADGFSAPYRWAMNIGGFVYHLGAILLIVPILKRFFNYRVIALTILLLFFATNIFVFMRGSSLQPHGSLLFLINLFVLIFLKYSDHGRIRYVVFAALTFGLICLNRPTDVVILVPAFLYLLLEASKKNGVSPKQAFILLPWRHLVTFGAIALSLGFIQFTFWKIAAGNWLVDSYNNPAEGLDLLRPHIIPFLFSFKSGWFIYTPLMLLVCIALLLFIFRQKRWKFAPIGVYLILFIYLAGSWTIWWYGTSFSQRAMIQTYGILSIPLAQILVNVKSSRFWVKSLFGLFLVLATVLNLWQATQYLNGVRPTDRMTRSYYFASFFDRYADPSKQDLLEVDRYALDLSGMDTIPEGYTLLRSIDVIAQPEMLEGQGFSSLFKVPYEELCPTDHCWMVLEVSFLDTITDGVYLTTSMSRKDKSYGYRAPLALEKIVRNDSRSNVIHTRSYYLTPHLRSERDQFTAYVWNPALNNVTIQRMTVEVYAKKDL